MPDCGYSAGDLSTTGRQPVSQLPPCTRDGPEAPGRGWRGGGHRLRRVTDTVQGKIQWRRQSNFIPDTSHLSVDCLPKYTILRAAPRDLCPCDTAQPLESSPALPYQGRGTRFHAS